jgi:hypothetical protein
MPQQVLHSRTTGIQLHSRACTCAPSPRKEHILERQAEKRRGKKSERKYADGWRVGVTPALSFTHSLRSPSIDKRIVLAFGLKFRTRARKQYCHTSWVKSLSAPPLEGNSPLGTVPDTGHF